MDYTTEGTTKRYVSNVHCAYADYTPNKSDLCQYGCEFEFYIDLDKYVYKEAIDAITKELQTLTRADILVDTTTIPTLKDKNQCMQVKPDISLDDHGIEISIPISTQEGVKHYIQTVLSIIEKYGHTNEETGFHIHISTQQTDGKHIDFYRFMLLCEHENLLSSWKPRVGYSQNVMDILSSQTKQQSRVIKTKKGTIWNLEKIDAHHIEIKSIGGVNYHLQSKRIVDEFEVYANLFTEAVGEMTDRHKKLLREHKEKVDKLSLISKQAIARALSESGILNGVEHEN